MPHSETYFPIYQCKLCTERIKRTDISTTNASVFDAIENLWKRVPHIAHLNCKPDVHGICELVGVYTL